MKNPILLTECSFKWHGVAEVDSLMIDVRKRDLSFSKLDESGSAAVCRPKTGPISSIAEKKIRGRWNRYTRIYRHASLNVFRDLAQFPATDVDCMMKRL